MPDAQVEKAEKWLRVRSRSGERALRALPGKAARSSRTSRSREGDRAARSRSRASEEESLWESAIRLRSGAGDLEEESLLDSEHTRERAFGFHEAHTKVPSG